MYRYRAIKDLIEFNLNTTLLDLEVVRSGADEEGEPETIIISGRYGFLKKYNLEYEYSKLKRLQDKGDLSLFLLSVRESIIKENNESI